MRERVKTEILGLVEGLSECYSLIKEKSPRLFFFKGPFLWPNFVSFEFGSVSFFWVGLITDRLIHSLIWDNLQLFS